MRLVCIYTFVFIGLVITVGIFVYSSSLSLSLTAGQLIAIWSLSNSNSDSNDALNKFVEIHEGILSGKLPPRIVFSGDIRPGYANKLYTVVTSMVVAVLTDSALIVEWKDIDKYIQSPLFNAFENFDSTSVFSSKFKNLEIVNLPSNSRASWLFEKKLSFYNNNNTYTLPNATRLKYQSNSAFFFDICTNPIYFSKILAYNLSSTETVQKANKSLSINSSYLEHERVENILRVGFDVASRLLRKFWRPLWNIQQSVDFYINRKFWGNFVIGIHLRYQYLSDSDISTFAKCALDIEKQATDGNKTTKWYVSSDSWKVLSILEKKYPNKLIFGEGKLGHTTHFPETYSRAVLDNELLSRCDEIIVTGGSSFGFVAAVKGARLPYFVEGRRNMTKCERMRLSRPPRNQHGIALF